METQNLFLGRGGGLGVSVLAFFSDDPSLIPAEVYIFSVKLLLKRTKINKKEAGVGRFFKKMKISDRSRSRRQARSTCARFEAGLASRPRPREGLGTRRCKGPSHTVGSARRDPGATGCWVQVRQGQRRHS